MLDSKHVGEERCGGEMIIDDFNDAILDVARIRYHKQPNYSLSSLILHD